MPEVLDTSQLPLFLLSSCRACVAGFTNITFNPQNDGLIDGTESYVSFSHYSDAVFLPQDPGKGRTTLLLAAQLVFASSVCREAGVCASPLDSQRSCSCLSHLRSRDGTWPSGCSSASSSETPKTPVPSPHSLKCRLHSQSAKRALVLFSQCGDLCAHVPGTQCEF